MESKDKIKLNKGKIYKWKPEANADSALEGDKQ
jgi:hypothetical protein